MPYINTTVSVSIPKNVEKELAREFGRAITLIRGKTEKWLMLNFTENSRMYFDGSDAPAAMVEVQIFGSASDSEYDALTARMCEIVSEKLSVAPDRVYVKYEEYDRWGWNGGNF